MNIFRRMIVLGACGVLFGCAGPQDRPAVDGNILNFFPIGGWVQPSATLPDVQRYRDAHFTVMIAANEKEIDLARQAGLPVFMCHEKMSHQPFTPEGAAEVLAVGKRHDNITGYLVWDEPSPDQFSNIARWVDALRQAQPGHVAWINLHPVKIVEEELPGVTVYDPYMDDFIKTVRPAALSYDNYGALRESNDDIFFYKNFEDSYFYYNMRIFRDQALKHDLPFWGFALTMPHWTYFTPTEADVRFQVYSLLTYGAKGLWYFTYNSAENLSGHGPEVKAGTNLDTGLVLADGTPTDRYKIVQKVNAEVCALGPTLLRLTSTGIYHLDEPKLARTYYLEDPKDVPELKREPLPAGGALRSVTGGRPLVGLFSDEAGNEYFMVMNKKRREMPTATRVALGEDRHRDELLSGHTLGQKFHADRPISAVSLLASSYSGVGYGAQMRLKKGGPDGEAVAFWAWHNLFADNAVIMRFPTQPAGDYYLELSNVRGRTGWWSQKNNAGQGGAFADGKPVPGADRNFIAYAEPDLSPDEVTLTFGPDVTGVDEVSKSDGRFVRHAPTQGKLRLILAQGDGRLFRVVRASR